MHILNIKSLLIPALLTILSGCGTTLDIISVESDASVNSQQNREAKLREIQSVISKPGTNLDVQVAAHYSYAALTLGYLVPVVYESDPSYRGADPELRQGYNLIHIDPEKLEQPTTRSSARTNLEFVVNNLNKVQGDSLRSSSEMQKRQLYAYLYLAQIEMQEDKLDSAVKYVDKFESSGLASTDGLARARDIRASIQNRAQQIAMKEEASKQSVIREEQQKKQQQEHEKQEPKSSNGISVATAETVSNKEYTAQLKKMYSSRLTYNTSNAMLVVKDFNIDCRMPDGRYVPLENLLLARIYQLDGTERWLESIVDSRDNEVRIYDVVKSKNGPLADPTLSLQVNNWGELQTFGVRPEAIMNACYGSVGPIWVVAK